MALVVKPKFANLQQLPNLQNKILNAYCKFTYDKQHQISKVKFNSSKNPDWDSVLSFKNIHPSGIIWVEIYHQQPPYDVLIGASSVSIKSLKLKPSIAKPETIDVFSTKQVKIGSITVMFEYIPSDVELEMGVDSLYESVGPVESSEVFNVEPPRTTLQQNKMQGNILNNKYPKTLSFTDSNVMIEEVQIGGRRKSINTQQVIKPGLREFIIPPINKNREEQFENLPSFGPAQSNTFTFDHNTESQNFSPQPSYQASIPSQGYSNFIPLESMNQLQYNQLYYQPLQQPQQPQQSYPPMNYRKSEPQIHYQNQYSYSNVLPNNQVYDAYAMNYLQSHNTHQANQNYQRHSGTHSNSSSNMNANMNYYQPPAQNQNHKKSIQKLPQHKPQPQPQPQPNHKQPTRISPKKQVYALPMSEKDRQAYLYKKMQQILKKKKDDQLREEMIRQLQRR